MNSIEILIESARHKIQTNIKEVENFSEILKVEKK